MFYVIRDDTVYEEEYSEPGKGEISVGSMPVEDILSLYRQYKLDRQVLEECYADKSHFRTGVDAYDDYTFGVIDIVRQENVTGERDKIAFIIRRNQFIIIDINCKNMDTDEILSTSLKRFRQNITLEKIVFCVLDNLIGGSNMFLENTEKRIMEMEKNIVEKRVNELLNKEIYDLRNRLSVLRNYYEQLVEIGEELLENENGIFVGRELRYIKIYTDKSMRLSENTRALSESLIHLREALDASLNYSINSTMKMFTVVTTIFLPLTLIAGWYGMNFNNMPELTSAYGYPGVITFSVAVIIICLMYFKKKKFL
ncbi:magnesium transporter CorA family protein [Lachnospiraceae bacterium HCP1S3_C3]|nr:hypothetical protein [Lachnospiraceae bacterium]MDD6858544.1 CorA family divalent cation transporter [Lachnospiraceae bacterium]